MLYACHAKRMRLHRKAYARANAISGAAEVTNAKTISNNVCGFK